MIFYLTGPDHSGKSTLAKCIMNMRGANYIHSTYNKNWNLENYHDSIGDMVVKMNGYGQDIVLDRWCLDAIPYRFVNKENTYNPKKIWNNFLHEIGNNLILIYCLPTGEFDSNIREEMFNENDMPTIENEFNKMFSNIEHYTYSYKLNGSDMELFINNVIEDYMKNPKDYSWSGEIEDNKLVDEKSIDYGSIPRVIACDFDDTLVKNGFPNLNVKDEDINWRLVDDLQSEVKDNGSKLVLWTNRTGEALDDAVKFCNEVLGLVFDAVNDNIEEVKSLGLDPRKVWADVFYDDKAITVKF